MIKPSFRFHISILCYLLSAVCFFAPCVTAQGFLPSKASTETITSATTSSLTIGSIVPPMLSVMDDTGKPRTLLSYKTPIEIMVLGFFTTDCPENPSRLKALKQLYEDYKGWKVSFVAVHAGTASSLGALTSQLKETGLTIPLLENQANALTTAFHITRTPALIIIDESGYLRFRGPVDHTARKAIETTIGHIEAIPIPEPPITEGCAVQ